MSNYIINEVSSFSILIATVISFVRFNHIPSSFRPFIYLLWVGCFCEITGLFLANSFGNNIAIGNLYVLTESLMLLWQFNKWSGNNKKVNKFGIIGLGFVALWVLDNLLLHNLMRTNSLFRVTYAFCIVFLGIEQLNAVFQSERNNILKNSRFLLSSSFVFYFTYKSVFEVFYMINLKMSDNFYHGLFLILLLVNLFTNLVFAIALLWIPKKQKFTLPF